MTSVLDLSLANFQLFQNTQTKHFYWSLLLLMSEILYYRAVALEKKAHLRKDFFRSFQDFRTPFIRNSTIYFFLTSFQSFRCSYFKTPSLNHLWWSLVEFWTVDHSPVLYWKMTPPGTVTWNFSRWNYPN